MSSALGEKGALLLITLYELIMEAHLGKGLDGMKKRLQGVHFLFFKDCYSKVI